MSRKSKGIGAERELVHKFWAVGWTAIRVAGSGSMKYPSPDIVAQGKGRHLAVECKACGDDNQYLDASEVLQLQQFADRAGCEAWVGVRFNREEWRFLRVSDLPTTEKLYVVSKETAMQKGLLFEQFVGIESTANKPQS